MSRLPDSHPRNNNRDRNDKRERNKPHERERPARRGATTTRRAADNRQLPPWLWLVAGIGGGMLITSVLHLWTADSTDSSDEVKSEQVAVERKPVSVKKPVEVAPAVVERKVVESKPEAAEKAAESSAEAEPVTQFDFYTLLPEREVIVPERETAPAEKPATATHATSSAAQPANATPATTPTATGGDSYLLQAGSFRGNADAERRRAQIAALGLQARIETVRAGSDTWYRVHAGPFTSRDQLATARSRLSAQGIETLQIRQK